MKFLDMLLVSTRIEMILLLFDRTPNLFVDQSKSLTFLISNWISYSQIR